MMLRIKASFQEYTYLDADNNPWGPVDLDALKVLRAEDKITDETSVMPHGSNGWLKYKEILRAANSEVLVG